MDNLTVIDNELVPVYLTDNGTKVVDGRELHSVLQSKQDFSTWAKKRLNECDAVENKDYELNHNFVEQVSGTKHRIDYTILLDTAKEMAMLERNAKGKQVRRYFIKVDEKYKEEKSIPLTLQQQIQMIAKGTDELYQRVDAVTENVKSVREDLEKFKADVPAFNMDTKDIQNALRKKAIEVLGGKDSNAYHDRSIHAYTFADIQIELRRQFNVKRYDQIRHKDVPDSLKIIEEYKPPLHIRDKIAMANAQQTLDLEGGVR